MFHGMDKLTLISKLTICRVQYATDLEYRAGYEFFIFRSYHQEIMIIVFEHPYSASTSDKHL